jgi:hypothetical protein
MESNPTKFSQTTRSGGNAAFAGLRIDNKLVGFALKESGHQGGVIISIPLVGLNAKDAEQFLIQVLEVVRREWNDAR